MSGALSTPDPSQTPSVGTAQGTGTGQHGIVPTGLGDLSSGLAAVKKWLDTPFTTPLDTVQVFALVGVVLVAIVLWNLILYHIRIAAETVI